MKAVIASAAIGSAHQNPNRAFRPMPTSRNTDSQKQASVWNASAAMARLSRPRATRRFSRASHHIVTSETTASAIPTSDGSGRSPPASAVTASNAIQAASATSDPATSRCARRSTTSTRSGSVVRRSARRRQMRMEPEADSTKLSMPKPTSATEPAANPAAIAIRPSTMFQPTVSHSSRRARRSSAGRSVAERVMRPRSPPAGRPPPEGGHRPSRIA